MCGNGTRLTELSRMGEDQALPATARWRMINLDNIILKSAIFCRYRFAWGGVLHGFLCGLGTGFPTPASRSDRLWL